MKPDYCPNCGAEVPERARACAECGSDAETGWSEEAKYDSLGIPRDEEFDYEDYVKREFAGEAPRRKNQWIWVGTAIGLLIAILLLMSFR